MKDPTYHTHYTDIVRERVTIHNKTLEEWKYKDIANHLSKEDCVWFINHFLYTYDPRKDNPHRPFVLYPFQEEVVHKLIHNIESGEDLLVEKSRDMGITWVTLAVGLWGWLYKGWDGRVGSRTEQYVDTQGDMGSLFEKLRYMLEKLPDYLLPKGFVRAKHGTYMKVVNPETGAAIIGEAPTANFGTGDRKKWALLDEFAYWPHSETSWRKLGDTTPCRIAVSTPEGQFNKFSHLRHDGNIEVLTLHWKLHPEKDEEWYEKEKKRRTPEEIAQELDISYSASVTGRVYPEVDGIEVVEDDHNPGLPLYTGVDFGEGGNDPTAIIWAQYEPVSGSWIILDALSDNRGDIQWFSQFLTGSITQYDELNDEQLKMIQRHSKWQTPQHWGDPYNGDKTMLNTSIKNEYEKHGVYINLAKRMNVEERIRKTRIVMKSVKVHNRCSDTFLSAMQNARYPQVKETSQATTAKIKPIHDWTSHYRTAFEYLVTSIEQRKVIRANIRTYKPLR